MGSIPSCWRKILFEIENKIYKYIYLNWRVIAVILISEGGLDRQGMRKEVVGDGVKMIIWGRPSGCLNANNIRNSCRRIVA